MAAKRYERPTNSSPVAPGEKAEILSEYFAYYEQVARETPDLLNVKLERATFADLLDEIGGLLLERAGALAGSQGMVRDFLDATELPECIRHRLPDEFRAFCLILNALKQWVSAESAATDRYILGGTVRKQCRQMADHCLITGEPLDPATLELHHPARDGRPPIPLSKAGHDRIESVSQIHDDPIWVMLTKIKREGNRSWVMLRRGCLALMGEEPVDSTPAVQASSRTFARKAAEVTALTYRELIDWLDKHNLAR
ncbi:MAG: hypothetical protein KDA91_18375 [Planctomycetaceae bacterium]|nr:hypothetical protein [Planctomycetaceae bacterium]